MRTSNLRLNSAKISYSFRADKATFALNSELNFLLVFLVGMLANSIMFLLHFITLASGLFFGEYYRSSKTNFSFSLTGWEILKEGPLFDFLPACLAVSELNGIFTFLL